MGIFPDPEWIHGVLAKRTLESCGCHGSPYLEVVHGKLPTVLLISAIPTVVGKVAQIRLLQGRLGHTLGLSLKAL